jgi:hypothetical protein
VVEVSAKSGGEERSEDDLGTAVFCQQGDTCAYVETSAAANLLERRKGQPQEEDELEDEVEREPVDDVDEALQDGK